MAAKKVDIYRETFACSICLDLLKDPVTIPCGHSYCMSCVNTHWNGEVGKQSYSCPQCRQRFNRRPVLVKNTMLAALMEGLKKSEPSAAVHVFCDLCSGKKVKADKSCLQCLVSYCKEHLQPHYDVPALKKHKVVEPTESLQDNICSQHDEVMKMFCRTDQQCICYLCSVDQHKGHDTVTAAAERAEKQIELHTFKQNILKRMKHKYKDLISLQHQLKNSNYSAAAAVQLSDKNLKELVQLLEKRMSEMSQQVKTQQEAEEHRVKDLQDKVEHEISELQMKVSELDTLSHTEDHVQFLHKFVSLPKDSETSDSLNSSQSPPPFQDMVTTAVSKLKSSLQETSLRDPSAVAHKPKVNTPKTLPAVVQTPTPSKQTKTGALPAVAQMPTPSKQTKTGALPAVAKAPTPSKSQDNMKLKTTDSSQSHPSDSKVSPQPPILDQFKSTRELREYVRDLTLDPQSLNNKLILSEENTFVELVDFSQDYSPNPLRFTHFPQVFCKQILTGRCSWMVDPGISVVTVAVAYKSIRRDGCSDDCSFGMNAISWALKCDTFDCEFWHKGWCLAIKKLPGKIVVFLDSYAGILSFYYKLEDNKLHHIHTVKTTFTKPLVAGLRLDSSDSFAKLCGPEFY